MREDMSINSNKLSLEEEEESELILPETSVAGSSFKQGSKLDESQKRLILDGKQSKKESDVLTNNNSAKDASLKAVRGGNRFSSAAAEIRKGFKDMINKRTNMRASSRVTKD